jgi:hypothetical protein
MRDVPRSFSIGLPVGSMLLFLAMAIINPAFYRYHIRKHETGWQEQATVVCLAPAVVMGVAIWRRRRGLPARWLGAWSLLLAAGALYYAGEECSWGQNYFGWSTPDSWSKINDQQETNLHNTSGLFDHLPRGLLTLAAAFCVVAPFVLRKVRTHWGSSNPLSWIMPTTAVVPAAALSLLSGVPQKIYGHYDKTPEVGHWFAEMFLAGRHSEMKECFLAMFILMYMYSLSTRLRTARQTAAGSPQGAGDLLQAHRPAA